MPRETITIRWVPSAPYEAAAEFYSALAYPDRSDQAARLRFRNSLCRWAILQRCGWDQGWGAGPQPIRPALLKLNPAQANTELRRGQKKLRERVAASLILWPFIMPFTWGASDEEVSSWFEGEKPNANTVALYGAKALGWKGDDSSTFKAKVWKPSRCVAHAAMSLFVTIFAAEQLDEQTAEWRIENHSSLFFDEAFIGQTIGLAEFLRVRMIKITRFTILEDETIEFRFDGSGDTRADQGGSR
jgi:hypothetical protein